MEGGAIDVDLNGDGDTVDAGERFRSSYYVLDVTDPEKPPRLLWRFTDPNLGFTTSYPAIAHIKGSPEKWFMVVGSGPDNNVPTGTRGYEGTSTQTGRVFVVNLLNGIKAKEFTTDTNAFMGDPTIVDGDMDFTTDVVYIGSVNSTTSGKVYRINTNSDLNPTNWTISTLIDTGRPLLVGPSVSKDSFNNLWVFFGTGRLFGVADKTNGDQQSLWGIKDGCWKGEGTVRLASVSAGNVVTAGTTDTACPVTYTTARLFRCDQYAGHSCRRRLSSERFNWQRNFIPDSAQHGKIRPWLVFKTIFFRSNRKGAVQERGDWRPCPVYDIYAHH